MTRQYATGPDLFGATDGSLNGAYGSMKQNPSWRHHHVPRFLLRKWHEADGLLRCWRRPCGRLMESRRTADRIMFEPLLYRAEHAANPDEFEDVFQKLETLAGSALGKFLDPAAGDLNQDEYHAWAAFLLSLGMRSPDAVSYLRQLAQATFEREFAQPDAEFIADNVNPEYRTPADFMVARVPAFRANLHMRTIIRAMLDPAAMNEIGALRWTVRRNIKVPLLLGDRPLISGGAREPARRFIALPLSPSVLFTATSSPVFGARIHSISDRALAGLVNEAQAKQAQKNIVGNVPRSFLEKRFLVPS